MKTSELKKIVEDNKFIFVNNDCNRSIFVYKNLEEQRNLRQSSFISKENAWFGIDDNMPKVVAQAILDYAYTPLEEREEEPKYILKSKIIEFESERYLYLINSTLLKKYCLSTNVKQSFTQKEIDAMPFDTNFFIKEEVK